MSDRGTTKKRGHAERSSNRGRGRGRSRGRGRGRGHNDDEELPSTSSTTARRGPVLEQPTELAQLRAEKALTKRRLNAMPTEVRSEYVCRKRQAELQRVLLPDAPPRKRKARKPSPEREPCPILPAAETPPRKPSPEREPCPILPAAETPPRKPSPEREPCPILPAAETPPRKPSPEREPCPILPAAETPPRKPSNPSSPTAETSLEYDSFQIENMDFILVGNEVEVDCSGVDTVSETGINVTDIRMAELDVHRQPEPKQYKKKSKTTINVTDDSGFERQLVEVEVHRQPEPKQYKKKSKTTMNVNDDSSFDFDRIHVEVEPEAKPKEYENKSNTDINVTDDSGSERQLVEEEVHRQPEPKQSINVTDSRFKETVDDWMLADVSDVDTDIEIDDDACPLPNLTRNATTEPAFDCDMTEIAVHVLRDEDELNDRLLRNIVPDEDSYNFDWKKDRTSFTGQRETFTGTSGPTFDVTNLTPVDIFYKMFDSDFIDRICTETNRYADQKIALLKTTNKLLPSSRLHRWTRTDRAEMITFLAILILQGLYPMVDEEKYFKFNGFGTMPYFARIMSYNRFLLLKSMYHFVDNETLTDKTRLCKLQPIIDYFNFKFSTLYMPDQEIAIDESLLKWHGRLNFAQKIATKAAQVGVKSYELCESHSGYLWKFYVYAGKDKKTAPTDNVATHDDSIDRPTDHDDSIDQPTDSLQDPPTNQSQEPPADPLLHSPTEHLQDLLTDPVQDPPTDQDKPTNATAKIVLDLAEPLLHRGHTIIMDNFYNSPLLLRYLKRQKTDCYGTLRLNREFVPDSLKTLNKTDMRQGEVVASYCSDLSVMVWRDSNLVSMISTYHHLQVGTQNKYNRLTYKPKIVLDYNKSMGGVDRKDQILAAQPMERLRNKVWYKKVFCRLFSTALLNSFIIFSTKHKNLNHRRFRTTLAEDLLKQHLGIDLTTEPRLYANIHKEHMTVRSKNQPPIVDHDHFPARSGIKKGRCWICTRQKRQTRTIWKCIECNVNLCIEHCFRQYHKMQH